jgi:hypothetical protein
MSNIPKNINESHILYAIQEIESIGISNSRRNSTEYSLDHDGKEYPPKYVISIANKYANDEELSSNDFNSIQSKTFLNKLGFNCFKKTDSLKSDFAEWLLGNGAETYKQYYGNSLEEIEVKLDEINAFFKPKDIFNLENNDVQELKSYLIENIYGENRKKNISFFEYDEKKGNGRPKAIIGRQNYFVFLDGLKKTNTLIKKEIFKSYWDRYKEYFRLPDSEQPEKYKWSVLKQVYDNWNWNVEDKAQMFNNAFEISGPKNLWLSGNFYPITHTTWMLENFKEETINQFNKLFNEDILLIDRLNSFIDFYNRKLPELQNLVPDKKINYHSHGDLRALALYLFLQYPEKYFLFKYGMVKDFCIKMRLPKIKTGNKDNLENYLNISNQVLNFIKEDKLFIDEYNVFTGQENNYDDDSLHLLTQDFIYTVAIHFKEKDMNNHHKKVNTTGHKVFKCSMGSFLKDKDYKHINPIEVFEKNNLIVMHQHTANSQGLNFINNIKIGDFVYITYGQQRLSYFARVISDAKPIREYLDIDLDNNWIARKVEVVQLPAINNTIDLSTDKRGWLPSGYTTFKEVYDLHEANNILFNKFYNMELVDDNFNKNRNENEIDKSKNNKQPLNKILYGPPGTGKTYKTKKLAVEIIENIKYSDSKVDRDIIIEKYEEYVKTNQIVFTTFHQSMSYEDFVEGIKPKTEDKSVIYEVENGIFKEMSLKASQKTISNFNEAYTKLVKEFSDNDNEFLVLKTPKNKEFRVRLNSNNNLSLFITNKSNQQGTFTKEKLEQHLYDGNAFDGWEGYANAILNYLKEHFGLSNKGLNIGNYVLIIDEINRGNVSAIFGELITLLEDDKRLGEKEAITVKLPYSKDEFGVPSNLFIIGTMNTADRSVEALDTALRRRFSFEEILPDVSVLEKDHESNGVINEKGLNVSLIEVLKTINQRIELLIDKDHQIGHSYFFNVGSFEDLKTVFKDKILPLLEEYFYGDFGKIGLVLGENFIKKQPEKNKSILAKFKDYADTDFVTDKTIFRLKKPINEMEISDFISIYQEAEK